MTVTTTAEFLCAAIRWGKRIITEKKDIIWGKHLWVGYLFLVISGKGRNFGVWLALPSSGLAGSVPKLIASLELTRVIKGHSH